MITGFIPIANTSPLQVDSPPFLCSKKDFHSTHSDFSITKISNVTCRLYSTASFYKEAFQLTKTIEFFYFQVKFFYISKMFS